MTELRSVLIGRRRFVLGTAATMVATAACESPASPAPTFDVDGDGEGHGDDDDRGILPVPEPIPGGLEAGVHIFLPGPTGVTLPFSGLQLQGLDVEPSTITDFQGATALAYVVGEAAGSDGVQYGLEVDIRGFEGQYRAGGATHRGAFALV